MSNLSGRQILGPAWREAIGIPLDGFINVEIELWDQDLRDDGAGYNWQTNSGGQSDPILLWSGAAQGQVYRFTLTMDAPAGSVDQVRSARFTVPMDEIEGVDIRKGQRLVVTAAPMDEAMTRYQYVVNSGFNSGSSARRTIECEVDMARVVNQ